MNGATRKADGYDDIRYGPWADVHSHTEGTVRCVRPMCQSGEPLLDAMASEEASVGQVPENTVPMLLAGGKRSPVTQRSHV